MMDRHRGERSSTNPDSSFHARHSSSGRMPSRYSDNHQRSHGNYRGGFSGDGAGGGGHHQRYHPFSSPPNHPLGGGGFQPMGGGGGGFGGGGGGGYPPPSPPGQKRGMPFSGRGGSPPASDHNDGSGFAKLFIGSVPRTATEEDIRPLFEEHGNVIEVALIKGKRPGQQQGCCFIKYATAEEADRAIRALHNQCTLPGGMGPIQVRYADGERERLGAVEHKLFVGSLNRQATEKEVEEIFSPYGRVEDVYIMRDEMKYSRGCGFVKFAHRDMAAAAINALNGTYVMRGCDQPLTVRFADPKRPKGGESRGGPTFGGPGFGPRSQVLSGFRPPSNLGDPPMGGRVPHNEWHPLSPKNVGPPPQVGAHGFDNHLIGRVGPPAPSTMGGPLGVLGGPTNGSLQGVAGLPSTPMQLNSGSFMSKGPSFGQQISPSQKPLQSPQHLLPPLQLHPQQTSVPFSQPQRGQLQIPSSTTQSSLLYGLNGQVPISQPMVQQGVPSSAAQLIPPNMQHQGSSATATQLQMPVPASQPQLLQPLHQSPNQLAQVLSQQTQALQASFQSSQQAFSQLQQQLHQMQQQSNQNPTQQPQQNLQATKQQSQWTGMMPQGVSSTPANAPAAVMPSITAAAVPSVSSQVATPLTCNWTEHTSPEGFKYYYNSVTAESRWEKPEELTLFEQQKQQQQKLAAQQTQPQTTSHPQALSTQQGSQAQQVQLQTQIHNQQQLPLQRPLLSSSYQASGTVGHQNHPGLQATQDWMWKNKPAGT